MTSRGRAYAVTLVSAALAFTGCDYNDVNPRSTPSSDGLSVAQRRLAELAALAAAAEYDATYTLRAASGDTGTIRIVASPPDYRVDVSLRGGAPSSFIDRSGEVVSCTTEAARTKCVLVARPGEPVPELFDPGVQRLFSDALRGLAATPQEYAVTTAAAPSAASPATTQECFDVQRLQTAGTATPSASAPPADPTGFETGQYCFAPDGVLTRVAVTTGTLVVTARGPAPAPEDFRPPASPVALPDLPSSAPAT